MSSMFEPQDVDPGTATYFTVLLWCRKRRVEAVEDLVSGAVSQDAEGQAVARRAEIRLLEDLETCLTGAPPMRLTCAEVGGG